MTKRGWNQNSCSTRTNHQMKWTIMVSDGNIQEYSWTNEHPHIHSASQNFLGLHETTKTSIFHPRDTHNDHQVQSVTLCTNSDLH